MANDEQIPPTSPEPAFTFWMAEIEAAKKREKDFRTDGEDILKLYAADASRPTPFNILYSNTETMMPALYSRVPRPYVERRFKDEDALGKAAGQAGTRVLEFLVDTNLDGYDDFHEAMGQAVLSGVLPGRGVTRVKYDAQIGEGDYTTGELVCTKIVSWKRFFHGYARTWSAVPWIAYEYDIDKAEAKKQFGAVADKLTFTDDVDDDKKEKEDQHRGEKKIVRIVEIWDKDGGRTVRFFCPNYNQGPLKEIDDPLGLTGFFDCPRPLTFVDKHDTLVPTALYTLYREQAQELNELTRRIKKLTKALKARGLYAGDVSGDLAKLMEADDNELVPADTAGSLTAEKGLQNAIWMLPLDQWIIVLRELMGIREQCKQTIYEITGISDILRGATKASETLGAQELKNQWGTLRLKNKQAEVQRYARDILRLMLEIAAKHFSESTWAQMTGLPFLTQPKVQQLTMILQAAMQQSGGQPPQDPQQAAQLQQLQAQLQQPKWEDVLKLLQNDLQRAYKVDIETNSTVEPEATDDRKELTELLMACGQFISGIAPMVQTGVIPFEVAQSILMMIAKAFPRFGSQIEDQIQKMQPPKQPDEQGAEQVQKEKEMAAKEMDMQKKQAMMELQMKSKELDMQKKQAEMDLQMREAQLQVDQQVFEMQKQTAESTIQTKVQTEGAKLDFQSQKAKLENGRYKTENVVNQKVDQGMTKGLAGMEGMVKQLIQTVSEQSKQTQQIVDTLSKSLTAPRVRTAIRGKDGRMEGMEEKVA